MHILNIYTRTNPYKIIQIIIFLLIFSTSSLTGQQSSDLPEGIINALKNGNAETLSQYFNDSMELAMPSAQDNVYSKQQAKLIIKDFFTNHVPTNFTVLHKSRPDESQWVIGNLSTKKETFRVTLLIKQKDEKSYIHQLRFEQENAD